MGIKRIEEIRTEEIRARAGVANISKKLGVRLRLLEHNREKDRGDVVMRTWN